MSLLVQANITSRVGGLLTIGVLVIRRLESLDDPENPEDEIHNYEASINDQPSARFTHRYGDAAWVCIARALEACGEGVPR